MQMTGKVSKVEIPGKFKTLHITSNTGECGTVTVCAEPPAGHEIDVGDTVDVLVRPQDGSAVGVARHPKS